MMSPTITLGLTGLLAIALTLVGCGGSNQARHASPAQADHDADPAAAPQPESGQNAMGPVLAFTMDRIDGTPVDLADYHGRVLLIVNTASRCGFTRQYNGLQQLHERFADAGLAVLGFPANNFGNQEPGSNEEIATFCEANFGVTFDMFSKISVRGADTHPLFAHLTSRPDMAGDVRWNFEKFLVDRNGNLIARFPSRVDPMSDEMIQAVEAALKAGEGV